MVLLHIKKSDSNQFIYETTRDSPVEQVIRELVTVSNLRLKLDKVATAIEDLIKKGPLKPEETRGLSDNENSTTPPFPDHLYTPDETHYRTGWCVPESLGVRVLETLQSARHLIHKSRTEQRVLTTITELSEHFQLMRGALMMAYPGYHGLPAWEPAMLIYESPEPKDLFQGEDWIEESDATLWFAGKELLRGKALSFYVKGNENTKIIAKLTRSGSGAPVREPLVDPETQKQMLAWHHKKSEEAKKMQSVDEDDYLNSAWADPRGLKKQLHGSNDIKWRFN